MIPQPDKIETDSTTQDRPALALLYAPPTRREMLLFGLLLLAIVFAFGSSGPRTVVVVPDEATRVGVIT